MREDYEFKRIEDIYDEVFDNEGRPTHKLIKKNHTFKWYVNDLNDITQVRECITKKGRNFKTKCDVYHQRENRWTTVKGSPSEIINLLKRERPVVIGFKRY